MSKQQRKDQPRHRAKRRAESQKLGQIGELIFEKWAVENGLNPHPSKKDLGIDYFCERLRQIKSRVEEITGVVMVAQVRATQRDNRPQIRLGRSDVETALRVQLPFCLVAVSLITEQVWFAFLDAGLLDDWAVFLASSKKTYTYYVERMQTGSDTFSRALREVSRPGFRHMLEQCKAHAHLHAVLPDAALEVRGGPEGWALVKVPELLSIFKLDSPTDREHAMRIVFTPQPFSKTFESVVQRFQLHQPFGPVSELAVGPLLVVGGTERPVTLFVEWQGQRVEGEFLERRVHDQRAYIGSSGLVLQISDARRSGNTGPHYHDFQSSLEFAGALDLVSSGHLSFLKLLRTGAYINETGRSGLSVEMFDLHHLGEGIAALEQVFDVLKIPLTEVHLADFTERDFDTKIAFLEVALDKSTQQTLIPTFVIGLPEATAIDERNWRSSRYRVPVALNLKGRGLIVWIEGDAAGYLHQGAIHGFRFDTATVTSVDTSRAAHPEVEGIEAWIYQDWPPIPVTTRETTVVARKPRTPRLLNRHKNP